MILKSAIEFKLLNPWKKIFSVSLTIPVLLPTSVLKSLRAHFWQYMSLYVYFPLPEVNFYTFLKDRHICIHLKVCPVRS